MILLYFSSENVCNILSSVATFPTNPALSHDFLTLNVVKQRVTHSEMMTVMLHSTADAQMI